MSFPAKCDFMVARPPTYEDSMNNYHNRNQPNYHNRNQPNYHNRNQPNYHNRIQPNYHNRIQPNYHNRIQPNYHSSVNTETQYSQPKIKKKKNKKQLCVIQ
jgi:hypothetical protein